MKVLRCIKPGCGNTFLEGTTEFEDGFCSCGAALEAVEEESTVQKSVEDIINEETVTPRFEHEVEQEQPRVDVTVEQEQPHVEEVKVEETVQVQPELPTVTEESTIEETIEETVEEAVEVVEPVDAKPEHVAVEEESEQEQQDEEIDNCPLYLIGVNNEIVFKGDEEYDALHKYLGERGHFGDPYADYKGDRIEVILNGSVLRTYPLLYDEVLIGREHSGVKPEIDYTDIDPDRYISRRHALIYRQQNEYFIRNESNKNPVHVNKEALQEKEFLCLQDGDQIVLSRRYGLIFKKGSESETI